VDSWTSPRFLFVADGARAESVLGFRARRGSREALVEYLASRNSEDPVEARA
jgi:hypothetical protein